MRSRQSSSSAQILLMFNFAKKNPQAFFQLAHIAYFTFPYD